MASAEGQENNADNDDNADEDCLRLAEDVYGLKFSDYISFHQEVATTCTLNMKEMCDDAKSKNNGEEADDNVHADETENTPVPNLT
ncbi:hypothetical protein NPIL_102861 [Nephila pilipes]|uniref:Uncharacterized protein n=1 Tax=Nephila pilipes TaxID=299642 RepID=A0A8X6ULB6_NEPPI|nr:hypothetical protein NPIL_102861 [Nephila pilipes]